MALICDHTGQGINLSGSPDGNPVTVRGILADSTSGIAGTWQGWRNTNFPVKVILDGSGSIIQQNGNNVMFHPSTVTSSNCEDNNPPTTDKYDCLNGQCINSNTYNTPGIYSSLENCQSNCAKNSCPDGYECVEIASTEKLRKCICG